MNIATLLDFKAFNAFAYYPFGKSAIENRTMIGGIFSVRGGCARRFCGETRLQST